MTTAVKEAWALLGSRTVSTQVTTDTDGAQVENKRGQVSKPSLIVGNRRPEVNSN